MIQICKNKLLIFHLLLLMSVLACETSEILTFTAHERGKVEIQCSYESNYKEDKKYLCRGECPRWINKDMPVESDSAAEDERFSLKDNKTAHIFTVTITDLRTEDQGQYWCGVKTGFGNYDYKKEIFLEIKHVSRVSGVKRERLNISCSYESEWKDSFKFICRASSTSLCEKSIKVSSEKNRTGRFSLRDDTSAGVFTVTITDLTEEDSGIYWCGAGQRGHGQKNKWISVFDLNIIAERMPPKPTTTTASLHTNKPTTAADTASDRTGTSLLSSSSSSSSPSSPSASVSLTANAMSAKPQTGFTSIIILSVMGIWMVFGFLLRIFFRCTQKKEALWLRGDALVLAEDLSTKEATHTVCHYEEIICTDNHSGYSLGLPVFDERDSDDTLTIIFQSINHADRTLQKQLPVN